MIIKKRKWEMKKGDGQVHFYNQNKPNQTGIFFLSELDEIWYAQISPLFPTACKI